MKLEIAALRSKIALRTFVLFVVSTLIPLIVFALLSRQYFTRAYIEEVEAGLKESAKSYGITLFARLTRAESVLASLVGIEDRAGFRERVDTLVLSPFKGLSLRYSDQDAAWTQGERVTVESGAEVGERHQTGIVLTKSSESGEVEVVMRHRFQSRAGRDGVVAGLLDPSFLWGIPTISTTATACVSMRPTTPNYSARPVTTLIRYPWGAHLGRQRQKMTI